MNYNVSATFCIRMDMAKVQCSLPVGAGVGWMRGGDPCGRPPCLLSSRIPNTAKAPGFNQGPLLYWEVLSQMLATQRDDTRRKMICLLQILLLIRLDHQLMHHHYITIRQRLSRLQA